MSDITTLPLAQLVCWCVPVTESSTGHAGVALSIFLYLLASADMFYTARYFHAQRESLLAAACVATFFKLPLFQYCRQSGWTGKLAQS